MKKSISLFLILGLLITFLSPNDYSQVYADDLINEETDGSEMIAFTFLPNDNFEKAYITYLGFDY